MSKQHTARIWTEDRLETVRRCYPHYATEDTAFLLGLTPRAVYQKAFSMGLKKTAAYRAANPLRPWDGVRGGGGRFTKGHATWNRGMKGLQSGGKATQFKPGNKPQHTQPIGSTKLDKGGLLLRKVSDAPGNAKRRWRTVHELVWIEHHGAVPEGHIVVFKPGQRTNKLEEITIDRVECISRADNLRRNSVHNLPKPLVELIRLRGALNRQINKRSGASDA